MFFVDAGSSFCKIYNTGETSVKIIPTREMIKKINKVDWGTGHSSRRIAKNFENDLISLSSGALALVEEEDFTMLDLGSRDAKVVSFTKRKPVKLDWSVGCAAATGATLEMLGKFYNIDFDEVEIDDTWTAVTCGTYAVERIMDAVSKGEHEEKAIGRFIHGLARNAFTFSQKPEKLYLSGGFTQNKAFVKALSKYTEIIKMGRTVPLAGLWALACENGNKLGEIPEALKKSTCLFEKNYI
jgi:activator of 2-hydroxyglutaryl-CoA dehydratase